MGRFPEYLSATLLSYAVGRQVMQGSAMLARLASTDVDERLFGAGMTALKLIDTFILQTDPSVCWLPAFAPGFSSLERCLADTGVMHGRKTVLLPGSEPYYLVAGGSPHRFNVSWWVQGTCIPMTIHPKFYTQQYHWEIQDQHTILNIHFVLSYIPFNT